MNRDFQAMQLAEKAFDLPPTEIDAFLAEQCGDDSSMMGEVRAILLASTEATDLFPKQDVELTEPAVRAPRLAKGRRLQKRYEVIHSLGSGGMGEVFRARDLVLNRDVALKVLNDTCLANGEMRDRFNREVRSVASLSDSNIVAIHDFSRDGEIEFAVMEFVAGETLRERITQGLSLLSAVKIVRDVASGLKAAHALNLMHRDIKPENIIVDHAGNAKVLDFGLAKPTMLDDKQELTIDAMIPGTIPYMSPEQAEGKSLSTSTDIFSLGTCLYECLIGKNPFRGDNAIQTLRLVSEANPPSIESTTGSVPHPIARLVASMLSMQPEQRPTAARVVEQLEAILQRGDPPDRLSMSVQSLKDSTATVTSTPNNLSGRLVNLIGRDQEVAQILECVNEHRVVTVVGPGGVGKTSLALRVARDSLPKFPGGIWLCEFASINRADAVFGLLAGALDGNAGSIGTIDEIVASLQRGKSLLVFDNCEHVIDEAAELVETLMRRCPEVTIIATSREALGIPGESVRQLDSLDYRGPENDAATLFVERVKSLTGIDIAQDQYDLVAQIVERLDGMPLAIELAAPHVRSMPLNDLLEELDDQLATLAGSRRGSGRQATLDRTIQWSFDLLQKDEQEMLLTLAVFAAPFTREAAMRVTDSTGAGKSRLRRLVEQSVVLQVQRKGWTRYRMLEPYRQFCMNQVEKAELDRAKRRHAKYFANRATKLGLGIYGENEIESAESLNVEWPDLRNAIAWGRHHQDSSVAIDPIVSLARTVLYHGRAEAFGWLYDAMKIFPEDVKQRADVHWAAALGSWMKGDTGQAYEMLERADGITATPQSLWSRYVVQYGEGRYADSLESIDRAIQLASSTDDLIEQRWLSNAYRVVPILMLNPKDDRVDDAIEKAEAVVSRLDWPTGWSYLSMVKGTTAMLRQDLVAAALHMSESVRLARSCANRGIEMLAGLMSDGFSGGSAPPQERLNSSVNHLSFLIETDGESHLPLAVRSVVTALLDCGHVKDAVRCSAIIISLQGVGDQNELSPKFEPMMAAARATLGKDFDRLHAEGEAFPIERIAEIAKKAVMD